MPNSAEMEKEIVGKVYNISHASIETLNDACKVRRLLIGLERL